jgi:MFS transporter, DHA2 family, methylenomycin A resistance protein
VARLGPRPPVLAGLTLLTAGGLMLGWATRTGAGYGPLAFGLLLTGCGVSSALPALVAAIIDAAPEGAAGAAGGLLNAVRQAGATLGVATMGAVLSVGTTAGPAYALLLSALVCAAAGAWFALGSPGPDPETARRHGGDAPTVA